jgi:hypothetical protein
VLGDNVAAALIPVEAGQDELGPDQRPIGGMNNL